MCEFSVLFKGEIVFEDVIHAKAEGSKVIVRNVLGESKVIKNCKIVEIDVGSEHLVLSPTENSQ